MMGNFLTTLGNTPESDREMFTDLGLNVARQPDNAANPRPDNRTGWMSGRPPTSSGSCSRDRSPRRRGGRRADPDGGHGPLSVRLWDPSTQLRFRAKRGAVPPRPDGSPNRAPVASQGAP